MVRKFAIKRGWGIGGKRSTTNQSELWSTYSLKSSLSDSLKVPLKAPECRLWARNRFREVPATGAPTWFAETAPPLAPRGFRLPAASGFLMSVNSFGLLNSLHSGYTRAIACSIFSTEGAVVDFKKRIKALLLIDNYIDINLNSFLLNISMYIYTYK